jgi:glucose-1-phosphatase
MSHKIAGIIFDINGVLVALDGVPSMARLLGIQPDHETLHAMWLASPAVVAHETGKLDAVAFSEGVVADLGLGVAPEDFLHEFCSWPTGLMSGALQLLDEIPGSYRVAALSNTSAVHWEKIQRMGLVDRFDQTYLSHEIGHLKPSVDAFLVALKGMELSPSNVLFLDDSARNVEAAVKLGIYAHLVRGPAEARGVLVQYGVVSPSAA